jgi:2-polyprenyl-6-methoxyphenol hydroxylase-like FAD-dependent oxidoreductase
MSDEQSRRYCEQVFSDDLGGHPLLTNRSKWLNFKAVINRRWSYKNVVLIGDALRSVHFSIGSGTRSALEDAIALYQACTAHDDVKTALKAFEWARRPTVEQLLAIAARSSRWYEHFRNQMYLDPLPFAYDYMTRSGKIDHESLRKRSPNFIAEYDAYITGSVNNANNAKYG